MEIPQAPLAVDERERKINVQFKLWMLAWYVLMGITLIYVMSNHQAAIVNWERNTFGNNYKIIVGSLIIVALGLPVWIARMIVHRKTGVLVKFRGRR